MMLEKLDREIAKGATWTIAMGLTVRGIGLVSTIVLARLLGPTDFGLVAMALLVVALLEAVSEMSLDVTLIQNQGADRADYDTVWTMSIIRGALSALVIAASAKVVADFYGEPRLSPILFWLAISALVLGFINVGIVDFRKHMNFRKDYWFMVNSKGLAFAATMGAAVVFRNYWALIVGTVTLQICRVGLSFIMSSYRPRICLGRWRKILSFTKWLLFSNMLRFLQNRSDTLIIAKLVGAASLGLYTIAHEISSLASTELVAPIRRALLPGYSIISRDRSQLRTAYLEGLAVILCLGTPVAIGIGVTADLHVPLFLGPKWLEAVPLIKVLSIAAAFHIGTANTSPLLVAQGTPHLVTVALICSVALGLPITIWAGVNWGVAGVAWGTVAASAILSSLFVTFAARAVRTPLSMVTTATWRTFASLIMMAISVHVLTGQTSHDMTPPVLAVKLIAACAVGAFVYVLVHLILWRLSGAPELGPERKLLKAVAHFARTKRLL